MPDTVSPSYELALYILLAVPGGSTVTVSVCRKTTDSEKLSSLFTCKN